MKKKGDQSVRTPLLIFFALGIALRVFQAVLSNDVVYPDEHFQVLEPANYLAGGAAWLSSEWKIGMRSWILPSLYVPFIGLVRAFGITDGMAAIQVCRLATVGVTVTASWRFLRLLIERKLKAETNLATLALYWLLPSMIVWDTTTFSETASMAAIWIAMPWIVRQIEDPVSTSRSDPPYKWIGVGLLVSLPWLFRYPMGAWTLGFLGSYLWFYRPPRKQFAWILLGACIPILAAGALDWVTWGSPFQSVIAFVRVNLVEGVASGHGVSPWFAYIGLFWKNVGPVACTGIAVAWALSARLGTFVMVRQDRLILASSLFYAVFHSLIGHKEIRFLLPVFPAVFYFLALCIDAIFTRMPDLVADLRRPLRHKIVLIAILALLFPAIQSAIPDRSRFDESDMADLSVALSDQLRAHPPRAQSCLLIVETSIVWTRGQMLLGDRLKVREVTLSEIKKSRDADPNAFSQCDYALSARGTEVAFPAVMEKSWALIAKNRNGHLLFARKDGP